MAPVTAPNLQIAHLQLRGFRDARAGVVQKKKKRVTAAIIAGQVSVGEFSSGR
jgi:hypothetical protein